MDIRNVSNTTASTPMLVDKKITTPEPTVVAKPVAAPAVIAYAEPPAPTMAQLNQAINKINEAMKSMSQDLEFSIDEDSDRTVVKIIDQKTKEVLRQIPSPEALAIAKALDQAKGLLIQQKA